MRSTYICVGRGRLRLNGRIIDFADVLVSVRVILVGGFARPCKPGGSGVEAPAMVAWTSSSGISVQAYRTVMVAEALAVRRRWWRRQGRDGGGARRAAALGAVLRFGRPCDHAATSFSSSSSLTCPDQFIDRVLTFQLCGRDVYPQYKLRSRPQRFSKCRLG